MKTKLKEIKTRQKINLSHKELKDCISLLNLHHLGDTECNYFDDTTGAIIAKYPEKETPEFKESHFNIRSTQEKELILELWSDGTLTLKNKIHNK